ncbi:FkbM family methyltransferase [Opitutus terrae]|nr:FkbM family methyltransferase [Opitutus terrae]
MAAQLQPLRNELTELRRTAAIPGVVYQAFRMAYFRGRTEPLTIPNIDYFLFAALMNGIQFVSYDATTKRMVLTKDGVRFATDAYFYVLLELFAQEEYRSLRALVDRPFVIYDVGMNRGYAALWFASHPACRAVYGFELFDVPYQWALDNIALNPTLAPKITPFCIGLGGENKTAELIYEEASDGVSTIMPEFYASYWTPERKRQSQKKTVQIKKASDAFATLPPTQTGELRVLKLDVEGAEYEIVEDLARAKRLNFDIILAEAHLGLDRFLSLLPGYRCVETVRHSDLMANVVLVRDA